ncbi:MAG: alpha/beta hydrolase, partial [Actinomycetota bacterium]
STGLEEVADAGGAIDYMRDRYAGVPLAIAGWSFGGAVAVRVASQEHALAACVAIAPAVTEKPGITDGLPPAHETTLDMPWLIVCAANDELVDLEEARAWAQTAGAQFHEMKGANHFFWAKYEKLSALVGDFLEESVSAGA